MFDPVKEPRHYAGDGTTTCKVAMKSMMNGVRTFIADREEVSYEFVPPMVFYWWGCAFKYIWRWPRKNGLQDIDKAIECLTEMRKEIEPYEKG